MAAQLRSAFPSPSPLPRHHPSCSSSLSRLPGIAHNFNSATPSFLARSVSGKPSCAFSVSSSSSLSPSYTVTDNYGGSKLSQNGDGSGPELDDSGDDGGGYFKGYGDDGGDGGGSDDNGHGGHSNGDSVGPGGLFGAFLKGWNERVLADPQFPFKVLMEEVVGVGACVLGDMASRPNFGLNELDFVFSTIVVGSILNFSLMYMLAPTSVSTAAASSLPAIFASSPPGHMFEHGAYSVLDRLGTFVYKGAVFATVGFGAGLLGTVISNVLVGMRKKMDPSNEVQVKAPPTVLNAATWAIHMGLSSNFRYQVVNGLEFAMAKALSPSIFKLSVLCIRAVNNVLGGMSFVILARLTGSQKVEEAKAPVELEALAFQEEEPKVTHTTQAFQEEEPKVTHTTQAFQEEEPKVTHLDKSAADVESSKEESLALVKDDDDAH
eukprot:c11175_g1_i1 orf=481-1785(-)